MLSGKGGVGKSTVSGMLGWALSHDEEVMVCLFWFIERFRGAGTASRTSLQCPLTTLQAYLLHDLIPQFKTDWIDGHRYMWSLPSPHVRCRLSNSPLNLSRLAPAIRPPQPLPNLHRLSPPLHLLRRNLARPKEKRNDQTIPPRCRLGRS